jgi:hypothetical protein
MRLLPVALLIVAVSMTACGGAASPAPSAAAGVPSPEAPAGSVTVPEESDSPPVAGTEPAPQGGELGVIVVAGQEYPVSTINSCPVDSGNQGLALQVQGTGPDGGAVLFIDTETDPAYSPGGGLLYAAETFGVGLQGAGLGNSYNGGAVTNQTGEWGMWTGSFDFEGLPSSPPFTISGGRIGGVITLADDEDSTAPKVDVSFDLLIPSEIGNC